MNFLGVITGSVRSILEFISDKFSRFIDFLRGIDDEEIIKIIREMPLHNISVVKKGNLTIKCSVSKKFDFERAKKYYIIVKKNREINETYLFTT